MNRRPLWLSLAATALLVVVLVALHAPIGNAAQQSTTGSPSWCDEMMTAGGVNNDDRHMGEPGTMMAGDDAHMDSRDAGVFCVDDHRGSPVAGGDCRDTMSSPVAGMGRGGNHMATPGAGSDCIGAQGTPIAGTRCSEMEGTSSTPDFDCGGMSRDCDEMHGSPHADDECGDMHDD